MFTADDQPEPATGRRDPSAGQGGGAMLDPVAMFRAVWRARGFVAACTAGGCALALAAALAAPPRYVATTQVLLDPRDIKVVQNEVTPSGLPSDATLALVESQLAVVLSNGVLDRVIERAGLGGDPEFDGSRRSGLASLLPADLFGLAAQEPAERQARVVARLRHALTAEREAKSFIVNLSLESEDADKAARLVNLTADVFIEELGRIQSDTARRATVALSSRLAELRHSVTEAEERVEAYKSRNALIGVGGRLVDDDYITRINDQLARIRGDITGLRVKAESMTRASVDDVVRGTLPEELSSEALVRLRQTYSEVAQQGAMLATKLGPRHPQRIASEGALTAAREAVSRELSRIVAAAQTELARAEVTERDLSRQIDELKAKQVATSSSFVKLRELQREVDTSRAVYEAFLLRARETGEQESLNTANIRVISEATAPLTPSGLSRKLLVVAGTVAGFVLGAGLAAVLAMLRLAVARLREDEAPALQAEAAPAAVSPAALVEPAPDAPVPVPVPVPEAPALRESLAADRAAFAPEAPETVALHPAAAFGMDRQSLRAHVQALAKSAPAAAPDAEGEGARLLREIEDVRAAIARLYGDRNRRVA